MVDVVKWTFAAARMACASDRVIQSAADGIAQSASLGGAGLDAGLVDVVEVEADVDVPGPLPFEVAVAASSPPLLDVGAASVPSFAPVSLDRAALRRSFFAQPDPLKWIAGAANAFRTGPDPHSGQTVGGSAWTPWIASKRRPHAEQS
jgi:hypothetical protein